jgi:hypothetical protein
MENIPDPNGDFFLGSKEEKKALSSYLDSALSDPVPTYPSCARNHRRGGPEIH